MRLSACDGASFVFERTHAGESILVALNYGKTPKSAGLTWLTPGRYEPLFAYPTARDALTVGSGGSLALALPAQSVQAFRLEHSLPPFGVNMYVRGTMNDWGTPDSAKFAYQGSNLYRADIYLKKGVYTFKIAGFYWEGGFGAVNWRDVRTILPGKPFTLEQTAWDRDQEADILYLAAMSDGNYVFEVDAGNVLAPVLTVRAAQ